MHGSGVVFWLESTNGRSAAFPGDLVGEDDSILNFARYTVYIIHIHLYFICISGGNNRSTKQPFKRTVVVVWLDGLKLLTLPPMKIGAFDDPKVVW